MKSEHKYRDNMKKQFEIKLKKLLLLFMTFFVFVTEVSNAQTTMTYSMESGFNINLGKGFSLKAGYRFQRIDGEIIDESFSGPTVGISYFF